MACGVTFTFLLDWRLYLFLSQHRPGIPVFGYSPCFVPVIDVIDIRIIVRFPDKVCLCRSGLVSRVDDLQCYGGICRQQRLLMYCSVLIA